LQDEILHKKYPTEVGHFSDKVFEVTISMLFPAKALPSGPDTATGL